MNQLLTCPSKNDTGSDCIALLILLLKDYFIVFTFINTVVIICWRPLHISPGQKAVKIFTLVIGPFTKHFVLMTAKPNNNWTQQFSLVEWCWKTVLKFITICSVDAILTSLIVSIRKSYDWNLLFRFVLTTLGAIISHIANIDWKQHCSQIAARFELV